MRPSPQPSAPASIANPVKLAGATALGIGGMMGAGLYSLLGMASQHAGNQIAIAFLLGAAAAAAPFTLMHAWVRRFLAAAVRPILLWPDSGPVGCQAA